MLKKSFNMGEKQKGEMTVREAGRRGGEKVKELYGHEFYSKIGHKGGQRVKDLMMSTREVTHKPKP